MAIPWREILKGQRVAWVEGWSPNGAGLAVKAVVVHDTVTGPDWPPQDLAHKLAHEWDSPPPPVYHVLIDRDGTAWVLADGRANHNGYGRHDNDTIGIAFACRGGLGGDEEPANIHQRNTAATLCRQIRQHQENIPIRGHKETDPERKIDPYGVDMDEFRRRVDRADPEAVMAGEIVLLERGDNNADVRRLQAWANYGLHGEANPEHGMTVDGVFGEQTQRYVRHLEMLSGREETTGKVDALFYTWLATVAMGALHHGYRVSEEAQSA